METDEDEWPPDNDDQRTGSLSDVSVVSVRLSEDSPVASEKEISPSPSLLAPNPRFLASILGGATLFVLLFVGLDVAFRFTVNDRWLEDGTGLSFEGDWGPFKRAALVLVPSVEAGGLVGGLVHKAVSRVIGSTKYESDEEAGHSTDDEGGPLEIDSDGDSELTEADKEERGRLTWRRVGRSYGSASSTPLSQEDPSSPSFSPPGSIRREGASGKDGAQLQGVTGH